MRTSCGESLAHTCEVLTHTRKARASLAYAQTPECQEGETRVHAFLNEGSYIMTTRSLIYIDTDIYIYIYSGVYGDFISLYIKLGECEQSECEKHERLCVRKDSVRRGSV